MLDLNCPPRSTRAAHAIAQSPVKQQASARKIFEPNHYALTVNRPAAGKTQISQMERYNKLVNAIVRYLMKEGFTFIEAYDQVLLVGRLNPLTTANQMRLNNPSIDQEAFLEFKAYNAATRLKRRYARVLSS